MQLIFSFLPQVPPDGLKQQLVLKQLLYHSLQLFTTMACDTFRSCQVLQVVGTASNGAHGLLELPGDVPVVPKRLSMEPHSSDCIPCRWPGGQGRNS